MSELFHKCSNLTSLPDISKWNINNVTKMEKIFYECKKLNNIPQSPIPNPQSPIPNEKFHLYPNLNKILIKYI